MTSFQFWNLWSYSYRRVFLVLAALFGVSVLAATLAFLVSPWPVFSWQQLQELQTQELPLYAFERGSMEFTVTAENYLIFERWVGNVIEPNLIALDVYFLFFLSSLIVLLSINSLLPRVWFYTGAMITAFVLSSFRWEALQIGGMDNILSVSIVLVITLALLFYFQFLNTGASLIRRLIIFAVTSAFVGLAVIVLSPLEEPIRHLAANTLPSAIVLLVIFIILVAHQTVASFVSLALASSQTHSLGQFLLISSVYLLNLWLAYLDSIGWMEWTYTIPAYIFLAVSGILTVWTIQQRFPIYSHIFKTEVFLYYFIFAFGTMAFATMGFFLATANDIVLQSMSDLVLYTHIGYGMMFLLYVVANFLGLFQKNLPIPKVLYKPTAMPYFNYRFAGMIVTLAFVFYRSWMVPVNHFISGYYTALGDLYYFQSPREAHSFYALGHSYAVYNQHAATALAALEGANGNFGKEIKYSADANLFRPTEFTILNTDQLYLIAGNGYADIQLLQEGKSAMPGSGVIRNNLGLAFARAGLVDSARENLLAAQKDRRTRKSAEMNLLGLRAKDSVSKHSDSTDGTLSAGSLAARSNALALANRQGKILTTNIQLPADSTLNLFSAALIANYLTNQTNRVDTAFLAQCIRIAKLERNRPFKDMILQPAAKACYASGQVNMAFVLLQETIFSGTHQGLNNYTLGLWAMDQEKYDVALNYFYYALTFKSSQAGLANAVSLAEEGRINEAIVAWDTLSQRKDSTLHTLGESMKRVLAAPASWFADLTPQEQLYYALYQIPLKDSTLFQQLTLRIKDEDLRARAYLNRTKKYFYADEVRSASRQYKRLQGLHLTDTRLFAEIKYFELRMLAAQRGIVELQKIIQQGILFGPYRESERVYYTAVQQEYAGDKASAAKSYEWLAKNNWYFDDGIVAAARFFQADKIKAYGILSEALQVNPRSVKILKAYIEVAHQRGLDPYVSTALETLRGIVSPSAYEKFVTEKQLAPLPVQ